MAIDSKGNEIGYVQDEYYIYEGEGCWSERVIDDEPDLFGEDEDVTCTMVEVNKNHYFKGWFFWNDMDDYEDKDEHHSVCFNNEKDLDDYIESNNSGGHFQCTYVEEWRKGELFETIQLSDEDGYIL